MAYISNYIRVDDDSIKDVNEVTKKIWEDSIKDDPESIVELPTKVNPYDEDESETPYLIEYDIYMKLKDAAKSTLKQIDPYNIPNVNFTLISEDDSRWAKYQQQRFERGFDDSETWSLDATISRFIEPRLRIFKEVNCGCPANLTEEQWDEILDKMILAFEKYNSDDRYPVLSEENQKIVTEGFDLFHEYFYALWW